MRSPQHLATPEKASLKRQSTDFYIRRLKHACEWLDLDQGRAHAYVRLLEEFDQIGQYSDEHILAYYESCEIVELVELWEYRVDEFPGLRVKLQRACSKGPVLADRESSSSSSNKPRNDVFAYLMTGKFVAAGISVTSVDGSGACIAAPASDADFTFIWRGTEFTVECKRMQSHLQLLKRVRDARNQIARTGRCGIIAIDCSVLRRPPGTLLETESPRQASEDISRWMQYSVEPLIRSRLSPTVLGYILYSRIPAMTATAILDANGTPYYRRDCISSTLGVGNPAYYDPSVLRDITQRLEMLSLRTQ